MSNQQWTWVESPAYAGRRPSPLQAGCHDRSPFLTVACSRCGEQMHLHETQLSHVPTSAEIGSRCKGCGELLVFPPGTFARGFAELRKRGWLR
jgi:ribosomal protein S27E